MAMIIYKPVVHDGVNGNFEFERQVHLLAMAGAKAWQAYMDLEPTLKVESDPMLPAMRELYQQLVKTDIFMGGFYEGRDRRP